MKSKLDGAAIVTAGYALVVIVNFFLLAHFGPGGSTRPLMTGFSSFQKVYEDAFLFEGLKILGTGAVFIALAAWRFLRS